MIWIQLRKMWPVILGGLALFLMVMMGKRNGKLTERIRAERARSEKVEGMRDAASKVRTDRNGIVKRLRRGDF